MKPITHDLLKTAKRRRRLCQGRRNTKGAAILAIRLKAAPHELRREWYRGSMQMPAMRGEPFPEI